MNWTNFFVTLTFSYLIYYSLNLLYDLFLSHRTTAPNVKEDTLFFEENIQPEIIEYSPKSSIARDNTETEPLQSTIIATTSRGIPNTVIANGAVGLKELFSLAKNNLIEHTSTIPY